MSDDEFFEALEWANEHLARGALASRVSPDGGDHWLDCRTEEEVVRAAFVLGFARGLRRAEVHDEVEQ